MEELSAAITGGDYARAHALLEQTPGFHPSVRAGSLAILLALLERYDEAEAVARSANLPLVGLVTAERERTTRWRDPTAAGSFSFTHMISTAPMYGAIAAAFARNDEQEAMAAKIALDRETRPIAGTLTFSQSGETRRFASITDIDDSIGQMLEIYSGGKLAYVPFVGLRRIEMLPRKNFIDNLFFEAALTMRDGATPLVNVPLLYAGSSTSPNATERSGRMTRFIRLGGACRGIGQRDFMLDGKIVGGSQTLVGLESVGAIDFA